MIPLHLYPNLRFYLLVGNELKFLFCQLELVYGAQIYPLWENIEKNPNQEL